MPHVPWSHPFVERLIGTPEGIRGRLIRATYRVRRDPSMNRSNAGQIDERRVRGCISGVKPSSHNAADRSSVEHLRGGGRAIERTSVVGNVKEVALPPLDRHATVARPRPVEYSPVQIESNDVRHAGASQLRRQDAGGSPT